MEFGGFVLKLTKGLGKMLLAFALLGFVLYGVQRYKTYSMDSFCQNVLPNASPASVLAQAKAMGFPAFDVIKERGVIAVMNQRSPYFRFTCEVSFKDGHLVATHVRVAD